MTVNSNANKNPVVSPDANVERNRELLLTRSLVGFNKYGVTTERTDLDVNQWLQHLLEELLDASVYVQAIKMQQQRDADLLWVAFQSGWLAALSKGGNDIYESFEKAQKSKALEDSYAVSRLHEAEKLMDSFCNTVIGRTFELKVREIFEAFRSFLKPV